MALPGLVNGNSPPWLAMASNGWPLPMATPSLLKAAMAIPGLPYGQPSPAMAGHGWLWPFQDLGKAIPGLPYGQPLPTIAIQVCLCQLWPAIGQHVKKKKKTFHYHFG